MIDYWTFIIVVVLVVLSGLFSGLTLGLLSLDKTELERKIKLHDKRAKKIYSVRKRGNLLLCTLLLGNVAVNSALAIFLGGLATGVIAGLISTGLIVIFGEILPQAFISRHAMNVGAKTVWLVKIFIVILFPLCWPISRVLDKVLGEEMPTIWSRRELVEIVKLHEDSQHSPIDADEERILLGALSFSTKKVRDIMTPRSVVFSLASTTLLTPTLLRRIKQLGFTRIPVYKQKEDNVVGVLYAKTLIAAKEGRKVSDFYWRQGFLRVSPETKLDALLNRFIREKVHLAVVMNGYNEFVGIVTLEDILEEILDREIIDETDSVRNLRRHAQRKQRLAKKK